MPKLHRLKTSIALLLAGLTSSAIASATESSPYFQHAARLAIINETPYLISYEGRYAPKDNIFWTDYVSDIPLNEKTYVGGLRAKKPEMEHVEGRFTFMLKDAQGGETDERFDLDFVITKKDNAGTFAKLQTRTRNPETGNEEVKPYRFLSLKMDKSCNDPDASIGLHYSLKNTCVITLSMSPDASLCHQDPDCNGREYNRHNQDEQDEQNEPCSAPLTENDTPTSPYSQ